MPLGGACLWSNQDTDSGGDTTGPPTQQTMPTQGGMANVPPASADAVVHDTIVVAVLKGVRARSLRINAYATTTPFERVEIKLSRGKRLLDTVRLKTLPTTPLTVEFTPREHLAPGPIRIAVYVDGKRRFAHTYHLSAAEV
jgi:hypothetical protein